MCCAAGGASSSGVAVFHLQPNRCCLCLKTQPKFHFHPSNIHQPIGPSSRPHIEYSERRIFHRDCVCAILHTHRQVAEKAVDSVYRPTLLPSLSPSILFLSPPSTHTRLDDRGHSVLTRPSHTLSRRRVFFIYYFRTQHNLARKKSLFYLKQTDASHLCVCESVLLVLCVKGKENRTPFAVSHAGKTKQEPRKTRGIFDKYRGFLDNHTKRPCWTSPTGLYSAATY